MVFVSVPLSGLVSVNLYDEREKIMKAIVSVPLSGLVSVNDWILLSATPGDTWCFRPLIGVSFCKLLEFDGIEYEWGVGFRPLIGVSFCKLLEFDGIEYEWGVGFRPLIGVSFCKHDNVYFYWSYYVRVSVPLSGLVSVNRYRR